jgi:hypothetical protein
MARPRTNPDSSIFAAILDLIEQGGEKAVAFSTVAKATGLAAPSLVQRYGGLAQMIHTALEGEWSRIETRTGQALDEASASDKGAQGLLKAMAPPPSSALLAASSRDTALSARVTSWRAQVEASLARHCGDSERAAMIFALWIGQGVIEAFGPRGFKMKDALRRLG